MGLTIKTPKFNLGGAIAKVRNEKSSELSSQKLDSRTSAINQFKSNSNSKIFVKGWMRRILRKESSTSKSDERSGLFSKRRRIKKTRGNCGDENGSPTTSRTVTDELSSQNCRSRGEESPQKMILFEQLSSRDNIQTDKLDNHLVGGMGMGKCGGEHSYNICCDCISQDQKNKNVEENSYESSCFVSKKKSDSDVCKEKVGDDNKLKFPLQKPETIDNLFPKGYPSALATDNVSLDNSETLHFEIKEDKEDVRKDPDYPSETLCERIYESPFQKSEVINFLFPMGHPDDKEKVKPKCNSKYVESDSTSMHVVTTKNKGRNSQGVTLGATNEVEGSTDHDCDKFIGLVISFDPTWDLLAPIDMGHTTSITKSRLKKFHEIENYTDSLLGNFYGEDASEESTDLFIDIYSSLRRESLAISPEFMPTEYTTKGKSSNCFDLGYHFDYTRFPPIDSAEVEICFYPNESSIESIDDYIEINNCNTLEKTGYMKFEEEFESLDPSEEPNHDLHDDEADSIGSVCGNTSLDKSIQCVDFECNVQSPTRPVVVTTRLHTLSSMSSPPHVFTPYNIYLLTDPDTNDPTRCEKSSISLYLPQFGSSCSTFPNLSYSTA